MGNHLVMSLFYLSSGGKILRAAKSAECIISDNGKTFAITVNNAFNIKKIGSSPKKLQVNE